MPPNTQKIEPPIHFDNSFAQLSDALFTAQQPTTVAAPALIIINESLAELLNIDADWLTSNEGLAVLAGNAIPTGAEPVAAVYAGHQFGSWNPQLGDGRAVLLGETVTANGQRYDIQLKGAGPTPYSRGGDGRSPLGPVLREYLVSEAIATLGIATTRSLAAVSTGEAVYRDSILPGGILTRVASSHFRVGTFEYFSSRQDLASLDVLCQQVIARHYPKAAESVNPISALLTSAISQQAKLIASWQAIGFIHGVMNTDNTLLSGETIDYGPCAFMDSYKSQQVFSSIDRQSRYAYKNQPGIGHWNMAQFAKTILPLIDTQQEKAIESAQVAIDGYAAVFDAFNHAAFKNKLGLANDQDEDRLLISDFLSLLEQHHLDFTLSFRTLADIVAQSATNPEEQRHTIETLFTLPPALTPWLERWQQRLATDTQAAGDRLAIMDKANPAFIPRNHLIEECIKAAVDTNDFMPFLQLNKVLSSPFDYRPELSTFALAPNLDQRVRHTFCGT